MNYQPEKQLWMAVIQQAIEDYKGPDNRCNKIDKGKAAFWLFRSKEIGAGSLSWICESLDLSINCIRSIAKNNGSASK